MKERKTNNNIMAILILIGFVFLISGGCVYVSMKSLKDDKIKEVNEPTTNFIKSDRIK